MSELFPMYPEAVQVAPKVAHVARKAVRHAAEIKPAAVAVIQGFSMLTLIVSNAVSAAVAAGAAWYVRGRGMTGVKVDLSNVKNEVETLKNKIHAPAPAV